MIPKCVTFFDYLSLPLTIPAPISVHLLLRIEGSIICEYTSMLGTNPWIYEYEYETESPLIRYVHLRHTRGKKRNGSNEESL
jgi:hypothetical protein